MSRLYLTGLADDPALVTEARRLRALGFQVETPAENKVPGTWVCHMRQAITKLASCDAMLMLKGWERSRGAQVETLIATTLALPMWPAEHFPTSPHRQQGQSHG